MSKRIIVRTEDKPIYDIVMEESYEGLSEELLRLGAGEKKLCIVTDSKVGPLYVKELENRLSAFAASVAVFTFGAGEEYKTLDTVKKLYRFLIERHFDRKDMLLALGGGVVGDLTGFAAATYLRGIDFIQLPTTLLSMVDSSIGGKTGVDFDQFKNMVGAFHMPRLVYMNLGALKTLDGRQFASGMAEILKHGLIRDADYYEWVISNSCEIGAREPGVLEEMIFKSCLIKKEIVETDPTEQGERALLNFGHTIGHAVEKYMNFSLLHGECVALGCVAAAYLSWKKELLEMEEYYEVRDMFVPFGLPITVEGIDEEEVLSLTKSDKKMEAGAVKFVLLNEVGKAFVDRNVTEDELRSAIKEIHYHEEEAYE